MLAAEAPDVMLCAAGGIGDGRGLAAALMLGADGVLVGSRLWASEEALVPAAMHGAAVAAGGDGTIRSTVMDRARGYAWPEGYDCRVLQNAFTRDWHGREDALGHAPGVGEAWKAAFAAGDPEGSNTFVGEVTGLIRDIRPAGALIEAMVAEAEGLLARAPGFVAAGA